ncbi:MAG: hypothetical protein KDB23_26995 [Planctomycetales bacterium]|nr:hypothetical protein [Planctomycetales bacterium]
MLQLSSRERREIMKPWLSKVAALFQSRLYWSAARSAQQRLSIFAIVVAAQNDIRLPRRCELHTAIDLLTDAGLLSRRDSEALLWCDSFLECVLSHHVDVTTRIEQLARVIREIADLTDAFSELEF